MATDYLNTAADLFQQGVRIFVPGVGLIDGAIEMAQTGSPTGAAKFFVPSIGIVEGAIEGSIDALKLAGGAGGAITNAGLSITTLALLGGLAGLIILVVMKK